MNIRDDAQKNPFLTIKDNNSGKIKSVVIPSNVQIGLSTDPSSLEIFGSLSVNTTHFEVSRANGGIFSIDNNTTIATIENQITASLISTVTVNLPSKPRKGHLIFVKDGSGTSYTTPIHVHPKLGSFIDGQASYIISSSYESMAVFWSTFDKTWRLLIAGGGSVGPQGPTGATGATGASGSQGPAGTSFVPASGSSPGYLTRLSTENGDFPVGDTIWTTVDQIPSGSIFHLICIGGGGGGAGGNGDQSAQARAPGTGGGGGAYNKRIVSRAELIASLPLTNSVGAGGIGGTSPTATGNRQGTTGSNGGNTFINDLLFAGGGGGGGAQGSTTTAAMCGGSGGGQAGPGIAALSGTTARDGGEPSLGSLSNTGFGGAGAALATNPTVIANFAFVGGGAGDGFNTSASGVVGGGSSIFGGGGGGRGGRGNISGSFGGSSNIIPFVGGNGGEGGIGGGGNGNDGNDSPNTSRQSGDGGGGGGGNTAVTPVTAGNGGNGGYPGGGGGGGGVATVTPGAGTGTSGQGGNGGSGCIVIEAYA